LFYTIAVGTEGQSDEEVLTAGAVVCQVFRKRESAVCCWKPSCKDLPSVGPLGPPNDSLVSHIIPLNTFDFESPHAFNKIKMCG
jgi:hypothetical protein